MPADDYAVAVSGGLKLKGINSSSKVSKSHRKKRPKSSQPESSADAGEERSKDGAIADGENIKDERYDAAIDRSKQVLEDGGPISPLGAGKTEAELRHEERRRKRLDERLKREGTKTHKERVEELNRYLSNLSPESALDKTLIKQRHMYALEADLSPQTAEAVKGKPRGYQIVRE